MAPDTAPSSEPGPVTVTAAQTMPGPRRQDPREPEWASATVEVSLWDLHIVLSAAHGTFEEMCDLGTAYADDLEAFNRVNDAKNAAVEGVKGA